MLEHTLVVWGGEFGRTPMGEARESKKIGRNHHIDAYTLFMAGGGIRPGQVVGGTDELGFSPVGDRIHIHDIQATLAPAGPRSHQADVQVPRQEFPADRCQRAGDSEVAGVVATLRPQLLR